MRIGIFIDTYNYGGAEAIAIASARFLNAAGHDPVFYHFGNRFVADVCVEHGIEQIELTNIFSYKAIYRLPWFSWQFSRLLVADRIELLHSHLYGPIVAGGLASRLAGIAHVGTLHDVYTIEQRPARAKLLKLVHLLGTELVCVSEEMAEYYARAAGIRPAALRVVRNGVDLAMFLERDRSRPANGSIALIAVGRLDPIKRHDLLLTTLSKLRARPDWTLSIAGEGPEDSKLRALAARLELSERVRFLGQIRDVPGLLADADVFVLNSDSEGMSLSLIEAVASGLPIVATRVGNNARLVRDGWNGFLIDRGSPEQLETALVALLDDPNLRRQFGARSRQLSESTLDAKTTFATYVALYCELVGSRAQ